MNTEARALLEGVADGTVSVEDALLKLKMQPFEDVGYARIDMHRKMRTGAAEVIYGAGKTAEQIGGIVLNMRAQGQNRILITRIDAEKAELVRQIVGPESYTEVRVGKTPGDVRSGGDAFSMTYHTDANIVTFGNPPEPDGIGTVLIATGGTSDIPVAEEAALTAEFHGSQVKRVYDVGVAGLHRLLPHIEDIMQASVIVAIAGMEGALASVVGGLAECPVIAVPTSVGYGASFGGVSALLSMLNSCASGVSVVNIDNGFGAGFLANRINHMR